MINQLKQSVRYRGLLYSLARREIQVRYTQSLFGIAWAIFQPLALMLMFTLIFSALLNIPSDGVPYPIFAYSALLPWTLFSTSLNSAIPSLENNAPLIKKIYFPRELFPIASLLAAFVDFLIAAIILIGMMFYFQVPFTVNILFVVPILLIQIVFTLGVCLFASAINAYYRDVKYALPLVVQLWLYASPIIYPVTMVPEQLRTLYFLNPMAGIIHGYRTVLIQGLPPDYHYLGIAAVGSVVLLIVSYLYFKRVEMTFADVL